MRARRFLVVAVATLTAVVLPAAATAAAPVALTAGFGPGARLGGQASVSFGLRIDSRALPSPVVETRVLTPAGLDIASSGLGVATCDQPPENFALVLVGNVPSAVCPEDAVLGHGSATAELRFNDEDRPLQGLGQITLFAGAPQQNRPGLVVFVDTTNPVSTRLAYTGSLSTVPRPFGLGLTLRVPPPSVPPFGATIALVRLRLTIGGPEIVYHRTVRGRRVTYRPGGVTLPDRCPRRGFRFQTQLRFADGGRRTADTRVACPPSARSRAASDRGAVDRRNS